MSWVLLAVALTQAGPSLGRAQAQLGEGDFEGALATLDAALHGPAAPAERAALQLQRGQCFAAMRQFADVDAAFVAALEADPEARLDPTRVTPTVVSMLDAVRERLRGTLKVGCDSAAVLTVDGVVFGECPGAGAVRVGRHQVEARAVDGDRRGSKEVVVFPNREVEVTLELAAAPRKFHFAVNLAAVADVLGIADGAVTAELGFGVGLRNVLLSIHGMLRREPGLSVRLSGRLPELLGPLGLSASADFTFFLTSPVTLSGGVRGGPFFHVWRPFELYLDVGWQHAAVDAARYRVDYLLLVGGLRAVL